MRIWKQMAPAAAVVLAVACLVSLAADKSDGKKRILFYSESDGFRHSVVARPLTGELSHAEKIFKDIATQAGYEVCLSQSFHDLKNEDQLNRYDAIVFYTSGNPKINREALLKWLRSGKAFIGIHAATDSFKDDPAYVKMIGGAFKTHGRVNHEKVGIRIEDPDHPATTMLPSDWSIADEIYQFNGFSRGNVHMLLSIDTSRTNLEPQRMEADGDYPVAWTRREGKGRVFYTSLGHREDVWTNPLYQKHLLAGIAWARGEGQ
jgi:hypothetical protein